MRFLTAILLSTLTWSPVSADVHQEALDAGALPGWAQAATAADAISLIAGRAAHAFDVDLFRISIDDPSEFSARTVAVPAGMPDPQLFLFDAWGRGIVSNDDWLGSKLPQLPAGNLPAPPGDYLLGIAPAGSDPLAPSGEKIFSATLNGLDWPSGLTRYFPVFDWTRNVLAIGGEYRIELSGVSSVDLPPTLAGDYNQDGHVDAADFTVWRNRLGSSESLPNDDTPGVGNDDYDRWKTHSGQTAGAGAFTGDPFQSPNVVPEPAPLAVAVAVLAILALLRPHNYAKRI